MTNAKIASKKAEENHRSKNDTNEELPEQAISAAGYIYGLLIHNGYIKFDDIVKHNVSSHVIEILAKSLVQLRLVNSEDDFNRVELP